MPQIIPREVTSAPTNITPGVGMAIGQGLQAVAGFAEQVEKGRRQAEKLEMEMRTKEERSAGLDAVFEKQSARQKAEFEIRQNNEPEDYIDLLDKWENDYDQKAVVGRSQNFIESYNNNDRINRMNSMNSMGTAMRSDILERSKSRFESRLTSAIQARDYTLLDMASSSALEDGIRKEIVDEAIKAASLEIYRGNLNSMSPIDRINFLEEQESDISAVPFGIDIAKEKARAVSEYNTEQSISAIQSNSSKLSIASELSSVFNDGTADYADAVDKLDSLGYSKQSAPYIYGMGLIESAYDKKMTGGTKDTVQGSILREQAKQSIDSAKSMIQEYSSDKSELSKEDKFANLKAMSDELQYRYDSIAESTMSEKDKILSLMDIRATHEKIIAGASNIKNGESIASQAISAINMIGQNRKFIDPVEEEIWRGALLDAVNKMPNAYEVIPDPDQRTRAFREIENIANLTVGARREYTGSPDEIIEQVREKTVNPVVVSVDQRKANVYSSISSGRKPAPANMDDARQLATAILPQGATQDVIDMEATRLMDMAPKTASTPVVSSRPVATRKISEIDQRFENVMAETFGDEVATEILDAARQFDLDQRKAYKYQPTMADFWASWLISAGDVLSSINKNVLEPYAEGRSISDIIGGDGNK